MHTLWHAHTHTHTHTWWKNDYTVLEYDKHMKLQFAISVGVIWFRIWTKAYGKQVGMTVKAGLSVEVHHLAKTKTKKGERERKRRQSQNFKLPDVWGMISHVRASFSKDWIANAAIALTLWASRQNSLLKRWLIVAYTLCTMLADCPDNQSIVQTTHLCPRCEAKVKVTAPWQTAYCHQCWLQ